MTIRKILESKKPSDIFDPVNWKEEYKKWVLHLHPDKNPDPDAHLAFQRLVEYKAIMEDGITFSDEICDKITFKQELNPDGSLKEGIVTFFGPEDKLKLSYENYLKVYDSVPGIPTFRRYLPSEMELNGGELKVYLQHKSHLIHDLTLEEKHVRWFLNRMLEFTSILNIHGQLTHCGINPNSVLICPEEHGIQVISFYHTIPVYSPMKSAIGIHPYKSWYPAEIWITKESIPEIDLLMVKRTALTVLGDKTGFGYSMRGKISNDFHEYLLQHDEDIHKGFTDYQKLLDKSPREFHKLEL